MSNERDFESGDTRVSEAYRQTAQERAPERLNKTVLRMAAGRTAYGPSGIIFSSWAKPVAWAATIGLSLAIVLELTRVPMSGDAVLPAPASITVEAAPPAESVQQDFERRENSAMEAAKSLEQLQNGPNDRAALADVVPQDAARQEIAPDEVVPQDAARQEIAPDEVVPQDFAADEVVTQEVALDNYVPEEIMLPEVALDDDAPDEDAAATAADAPTRSLYSSVGRSREAGLAAVVENKESDRGADCDTVARAATDSWLACIETLRETGDMAAAEREYADFLLEHPDLETHK